MLSSTLPTREEHADEETLLVPCDEGVAVEAVEEEGGKLSPTYRDPSLHRGNSGSKLFTQVGFMSEVNSQACVVLVP